MRYDDVERYTDEECERLFANLFPQGFAGPDVVDEIAPEGWEASPLLAVFHPSLDQVYAEAVRMHRNLQSFPWRARERPPEPEPTRDTIAREYRPTPVETEREVGELVGHCLWDIFSDNHDVLGPDRRLVDIGSFRGAGGFIADCLNRQSSGRRYDYLDFYMGTIWVADRAALAPVYEMIFRRLKAHHLEWRYSFPRLYLVDMRPLSETSGADTESGETQELSAADDDEARAHDLADMQASLDTAHREAVEEALDRPLPATVLAYESVYGRLPQGWPPEA